MKHFSTKEAFTTAIKDMQKAKVNYQYLIREKVTLLIPDLCEDLDPIVLTQLIDSSI